MKKTLLAAGILAATSFAHADVLTTIKPLGFIANAITDGVTETQVLLPVSASPHDYSLKPSDVEKLKSAELVVWVGHGLESFLEKSVEKLPESKVLELGEVPAIEEIIEATHHEDHDHDHDHGHHEHAHGHDHHGHDHSHDWHIWLSSDASKIAAEQIADRLTQLYPAKKAKIAENLAKFKTAVDAKTVQLKAQLEPVKGKGYYTFHEAYGYFESAYGLNSLGSFTINPTVAPGAKTLAKIKEHIAEHKAVCLFAEPQFTPRVVESLSKGTQVGVGQLDPLGAKIEMSAEAYPQFLQGIADEFTKCLAK